MITAEGFLEAARYHRLQRILGYEFSQDCKSFEEMRFIKASSISKRVVLLGEALNFDKLTVTESQHNLGHTNQVFKSF